MINKDYNKRINKLNNKGFSLVEVIVAMTILVVISVPIIDTFTGSMKLTHKGSDRQRATLLGQSITEGVKRLDVGELAKAFHESNTDESQFGVLDSSRFKYDEKYRLSYDGSGYSRMENYSENDDNARKYYYCIEGIVSGSEKYDALITLDSDGYTDINGQVFPSIVKVGSEGCAVIDSTGKLNGMKLYDEYCTFNNVDSCSGLSCDMNVYIIKTENGEYEVYADVTYKSTSSSCEDKTFTRVGDISFDEQQKLKFVYVFLYTAEFQRACAINIYVDKKVDETDDIPVALVSTNYGTSSKKWNLHVYDYDETNPDVKLATSNWKNSVSIMSNATQIIEDRGYSHNIVSKDIIDGEEVFNNITDYTSSGKKYKKMYKMSVKLFTHNDNESDRFKGEPIEEINSSYLRHEYFK